jgi:hypothetical protein
MIGLWTLRSSPETAFKLKNARLRGSAMTSGRGGIQVRFSVCKRLVTTVDVSVQC